MLMLRFMGFLVLVQANRALVCSWQNCWEQPVQSRSDGWTNEMLAKAIREGITGQMRFEQILEVRWAYGANEGDCDLRRYLQS